MALEQEPHTDTSSHSNHHSQKEDGSQAELHFTRYFANNHLAVDIHQDIANYKNDRNDKLAHTHSDSETTDLLDDSDIEDEAPEAIEAIFEDIEEEFAYAKVQFDGKEITAFFLSGLFSSVFLLVASTFMCYSIHNREYFIYFLISCILGFLPGCATGIWTTLGLYKRFSRTMRKLGQKKQLLGKTIQQWQDGKLSEQELRLVHSNMHLNEK